MQSMYFHYCVVQYHVQHQTFISCAYCIKVIPGQSSLPNQSAGNCNMLTQQLKKLASTDRAWPPEILQCMKQVPDQIFSKGVQLHIHGLQIGTILIQKAWEMQWAPLVGSRAKPRLQMHLYAFLAQKLASGDGKLVFSCATLCSFGWCGDLIKSIQQPWLRVWSTSATEIGHKKLQKKMAWW